MTLTFSGRTPPNGVKGLENFWNKGSTLFESGYGGGGGGEKREYKRKSEINVECKGSMEQFALYVLQLIKVLGGVRVTSWVSLATSEHSGGSIR